MHVWGVASIATIVCHVPAIEEQRRYSTVSASSNCLTRFFYLSFCTFPEMCSFP